MTIKDTVNQNLLDKKQVCALSLLNIDCLPVYYRVEDLSLDEKLESLANQHYWLFRKYFYQDGMLYAFETKYLEQLGIV